MIPRFSVTLIWRDERINQNMRRRELRMRQDWGTLSSSLTTRKRKKKRKMRKRKKIKGSKVTRSIVDTGNKWHYIFGFHLSWKCRLWTNIAVFDLITRYMKWRKAELNCTFEIFFESSLNVFKPKLLFICNSWHTLFLPFLKKKFY